MFGFLKLMFSQPHQTFNKKFFIFKCLVKVFSKIYSVLCPLFVLLKTLIVYSVYVILFAWCLHYTFMWVVQHYIQMPTKYYIAGLVAVSAILAFEMVRKK